jgi:hypothetical protein
LLNLTDLICQTFRKLGHKEFAAGDPSSFIVSVDTNHETWRKVLDQLQFNNLPRLRRQINDLPKFINPSELKNDATGSIHENIIKIQAELEENFNQILSIAASIPEEQYGSPSQMADKHLKEIKEFQRGGVSSRLIFLGDDLGWIFSKCANTIKKLGREPRPSRRSRPFCDEIKALIATATEAIDKLIKWLTRQEFINIQDRWDLELTDCDSYINVLTQFINEGINPPEPEDDDHVLDDLADLDNSAIPLARSFIPVIKLSRLFFTKLAKDGLNKNPLKPFTDMNSYQLTTLSESAGRINSGLSAIFERIKDSDQYDEVDTSLLIIQTINKIRHLFDSNLLLVILYIVPLVPNSISSPNYLQNSLLTWNDLFLMATQNCIHAAKSYRTLAESRDDE